ncbi:MAG: ABC transporter permease [Blautia sp.]|nr:ABC transporter permease [Blautia sp.]
MKSKKLSGNSADAVQDIERQQELAEQLGESDTFKDKMKRMASNNKLAVFSFIVIVIFILLAVFAPLITPYGLEEVDLMSRLSAPSAKHLLGTDELGRDVLTRLLYGARVSLAVGVIPTVISMLIGVLVGMVSGYVGGIVDSVLMRLADVVLSFPSLLLAMVIMYTLGDGISSIFIALAITSWASVARVVRSETLSLRETEYVEAARSMGVRGFTIIMRHILPNCIPSLIVLFTLNVPSAILSESSLSFLGIGVQLPNSSWGLMVNLGRTFLYNAPWLSIVPSIAIMIVVLAFNFLGDGLRDVLDPHLKDS